MSHWFEFLVEEWLWSITWGWYQLAFGLICSTIIFIIHRRLKSLPALIVVAASYWSAFVLYLLCVMAFSCYIIYSGQYSLDIKSSFHSIILLAIVFTLLQILFLRIVHAWYRIKFGCVLWVTCMGNGIAAIVTFLIVYITSFTEWWRFLSINI